MEIANEFFKNAHKSLFEMKRTILPSGDIDRKQGPYYDKEKQTGAAQRRHPLYMNNGDTFYWPSSPSSGGSFDDPGCPSRGDTHYWMVWHGGLPFAAYRENCIISYFGMIYFPGNS